MCSGKAAYGDSSESKTIYGIEVDENNADFMFWSA
jgi:hypothetical protein